MKFKLLSIALFFLLTSAAFGNPKTDTLSAKRESLSSVYLVRYSDRNPGKVIFIIKDSDGHELFRRLVKNETGFEMPVDFSSSGEGVYTVHTDNGSKQQTTSIVYNNGMAPTYSHVVNLGNNRYLFMATHVGQETITIKIYIGNILIFKGDREIEGNFSTIFNLKGVNKMPSFWVSEQSGYSPMVPANPTVIITRKIESDGK